MKATLLVVCVISLLPIGEAEAQEQGVYLGFGLGSSRYRVHVNDYNDGSLTSGSTDTSSRALRFHGGYWFNPNFALELSVVDLGDTEFDGHSSGGSYWCSGSVHSRLSADGLGLAAVGNWPLKSSGFSLFAKGGIFAWDWDSFSRNTNFGTFCGASRDSDSGVNPMYGVGVSYEFNYITSMQVQWERYTHVIDSHDVDAVTLGFSFALGGY
jgi:hypothetical protein